MCIENGTKYSNPTNTAYTNIGRVCETTKSYNYAKSKIHFRIVFIKLSVHTHRFIF
jgi:hypothetical protein